jgi:short subunit fatty acids transporter
VRFLTLVTVGFLVALGAQGQTTPDFLAQDPPSMGEGWAGFRDINFLFHAFMTLALAALLGAVIAYHPRLSRSIDTLAEIEAPKVFVLYAVIGALIGIMVVKYGLVVGFVLFGIGGLIRFRTVLTSAKLTGHVIFVTLIGLSCGLELPHVAVLATAFGFVLMYVIDVKQTFMLNVRAIPPDEFANAVTTYRRLLQDAGCQIVSEKKRPEKFSFAFIFQVSGSLSRQDLESLLESRIDPGIRGYFDLEIE